MAIRLRGRRAECEFLDTALSDALAGRSRTVVLRGEAGAGKTSRLDYLAENASVWRIVRAVGVESEMELACSGLHQLCAPLLNHLARLPTPQHSALATVFGHDSGPTPDRFLVGLATLTLQAEAAEEQPLCAWSTTRSGSTTRRLRSSGSSLADSWPSRSHWCARPGTNWGTS